MNKFNLSLIILIVLMTSCAKTEIKGKTKAEVLYKEAIKLKGEERYLMALDKISSLRSTYPYSFYTIPSELLRADILFAQENYIEAAEAYLTFRDFHPKHEKISYVMWMIAESYFMQLPDSIDRDLSSAKDAVKAYREVIRRYPNSEHGKKALLKIKESINLLDKREEYIADFYFRTKNYQSASYRYNQMFRSAKNNEKKKESATRLLKSLIELGKYSDCLEIIEISRGSNFLTREEIQSFEERCNHSSDSKDG